MLADRWDRTQSAPGESWVELECHSGEFVPTLAEALEVCGAAGIVLDSEHADSECGVDKVTTTQDG